MKSECSLAMILVLGITSLATAQQQTHKLKIASYACAKTGMDCYAEDDSPSTIEAVWNGLKSVNAAVSSLNADPSFGNYACAKGGMCGQTPSIGQERSVAVPTSNTKPETYRGEVDHFPVPVGLQGTRRVIVWGIVCPKRNTSQEIVAISYNEDCNGDVCRPSVTNWPSMTAEELKAKGILVRADGSLQVEKDGKAAKEPFKELRKAFVQP